jgi:hypothetical protein
MEPDHRRATVLTASLDVVQPCPAAARPSDRAIALLVARGLPGDLCLTCCRCVHTDNEHVALVAYATDGGAQALTLTWKD